MPTINKKEKYEDKKYSKLLNNLLDIKGRDKTIFTSISGVDNFDVMTKFGIKVAKKMITQNTFTLNLEEADIEKLLNAIIPLKTGDEIINAYENYKEKLFSTKKLLLTNTETFASTKKELIIKLKEKIQKVSSRWMQFRRKIIDINIQENVWPLYVATCFIKINTSKRPVYAPLLLKRIDDISVSGSKIKVSSGDTWEINEKLVFLLNNDGFNLDDKMTFNEMKTSECLDIINEQLNSNVTLEYMAGKFKNISTTEVKDNLIKFMPGVVMGIFKPSGGHLRKTMLSIIENNEMDDILDVDPDKSIYRNNMNNQIENFSENIIRIQPSNYSQDKALSSSLIQDTIIWGPPGTGKSQVIANIIANILNGKKTAIVMSQKKAALDVLKKRMGKIAKFCLFILNDNKMKKSEFYKPLKEFVKSVEENSSIPKNNTKKIISNEEIEALSIIRDLKDKNLYYPSIKMAELLNNKRSVLNNIYQIDFSYIYPSEYESDESYFNELMTINDIQKSKFLFIKYFPKKYKILSARAISLNKKGLELDSVIKIARQTNIKAVNKIFTVPKLLDRKIKQSIDQKYLEKKISNDLLSKIIYWKNFNRNMLIKYKKFANATRAGRALPYKFVNKHIDVITKLFPVIITTPETSFINWKKNSFDYAVLDESSQMFLETGLPILYLAKNKILAGDKEQMQPTRWFKTRDDSDDEEDVAENAESLLDYVMDKGVFHQMLDKNYRSSSASLMSFSAKTFYNSQLEVINNKNRNVKNPIETINVNGKWNKGVNMIEAKKAIEIASSSIFDYESIIVLTFNSNQRQLIEKIILENNPILSKSIEEGQLMIRNIENIQGDEADLVVMSTVYDSTTNIGSTYVARSGGKNALNVAISRAKEKLIVIKSVRSSNVRMAKSDDFKVFKNWLSFLDMNSKEQTEYSIGDNFIEESYGEVESGFERDVVEEITSNIRTGSKFKLLKQYSVGSKRIDIAIVDNKDNFILGIEVDGYKYHEGMGFDKYLDDVSRQEFLEQKGYKIFRIKEIDWKINRHKILNSIKVLIQ